MGKRLTKIATRTGDDGTTGLGDGSRVDKASARIEALGDIDELNSQIGLLLAETLPETVRGELLAVQHDLFDLGGETCIPGHLIITAEHVARLDQRIDEFNASLPALKEFILPGGGRAGAQCNVARAVCRRAERSLVALGRVESVSELSIQYLNRLSDMLFLAARTLNAASGTAEPMWKPGREGKDS